MTLDTMMTLGAELQRIREEKSHLQRLATEGGPAVQQELQRWERREAQVLNSISSQKALLEDQYEGYYTKVAILFNFRNCWAPILFA